MVIPAHPLALTPERKLDERRQRALTRYYLGSGAGGVAVGVHTTQFEIHQPGLGLYKPVLELAVEEVRRYTEAESHAAVKVAGIVGRTEQALREATLASGLGYDCGLLSLGAMSDATDDQLIEHTRAIAEVIPVFGFYLQPSVGGRVLSFDFWRRIADIANVVAVKIAPFNRYRTLDVIRAVVESGRAHEIALYTGNDDSIILDLLTEYRFGQRDQAQALRITGGLLGHWAVWTRKAVEQLLSVRQLIAGGESIGTEWLTLNAQVTDANSALFDPQHEFAGCVAGIHEILRRQGLMQGRWCLNPREDLSAGQMEEIDRVCASYPHLNDDAFVREHLHEWLS